MCRKHANKVIILWGADCVDNFYDYSKWTDTNIQQILDNVEIFEFETEGEAEAFRIGLCAVRTGRDFDEITAESYSSLMELAASAKLKKRQRIVA